MATFSVNQVRQLYVANELKSGELKESDKIGSFKVSADKAKKHLYFQIKGADNITRSDLIDINKIMSISVTDADKMAKPLKSVMVTLNDKINSGNPVVGQDYLLRIAFRQFVGMSDEDQYFKYGMVHAYAGMTASDFYKVLVMSLVKNFSREIYPLVKFALKTSSAEKEVDISTKLSDLSDTYTGVIITEVPQEWILGTKPQVPVYFEVQPTSISVQGDEMIWGKVEKNELKKDGSIPNGKQIADLEYFCMGERGDVYRNVSFPHTIPTKYLVNPDIKYNVIDIHYFYSGSNECVQKSEKTITIVIPKVGEENSTSNVLANSIIDAINTAAGTTIKKLSVA